MDNRIGVAAGLIRNSLSEATWGAYAGAWKEWNSLLAEVGGLEPREDVSSLVLYFIVKNVLRGASVSSVDHKLVGLAFWFKLQGGKNVTKSFVVRQAMKGYRKGRRSMDLRLPVSFANLRLILANILVCLVGYEQI